MYSKRKILVCALVAGLLFTFAACKKNNSVAITIFEGEEVMRFGKNSDKPLDFDAIIIDEASMVDLVFLTRFANSRISPSLLLKR